MNEFIIEYPWVLPIVAILSLILWGYIVTKAFNR